MELGSGPTRFIKSIKLAVGGSSPFDLHNINLFNFFVDREFATSVYDAMWRKTLEALQQI